MIGLLFFGVLGLWLVASVVLSRKIPRWLGVTKYRAVISVLLFPLVLAAPIADDLIGRWQFKRLCDREAVVTLSPDWQNVKRAKWVSLPQKQISQSVIPITSSGGEFIDIDRNRVFMSIKSFGTSGGLLRRQGYGLGGQTVCHPKNYQVIQKQINLNELMKNGDAK